MGEGILIDTDILIDFVKGKQELPNIRVFISEVTLYEFIRGTKDIPEAKSLIEEGFSILYHDNQIIKKASEMWVATKKTGEMIDDRDILIAAAAISKQLPFYTRNVKHYDRLKKFGLNLENKLSLRRNKQKIGMGKEE